MTRQEFENAYPEFIRQFNAAFDTPELTKHLTDSVTAASSSEDTDIDLRLATEREYQRLRTNNLIKAVVSTFLTDNEH